MNQVLMLAVSLANLFQNDLHCGQCPFCLIDTPGTETYKHAYLLKQALISSPLNTIFIVIRYENRFDKMLEHFYDVQQTVDKYEDKIVVMVSHWDLSEDPNKHFQMICKEFEGYCSNMIFFSNKSSNVEVANLMYSCASNMKPEKLQISVDEFLLTFPVAEIKLRIKKSLDQYRKKANGITQDFMAILNDVKSAAAEDRDEILHLFIVEHKNELEKILSEFRETHRKEMTDLDYFTFYVKMEKENIDSCNQFTEAATVLMSYNLFDSGDPRNLIKQCPHCQLIWFKTEGCDGQTTCGNKVSSYFDFQIRPAWKYQLKRVSGKLRWDKTEMKSAKDNSPKQATSATSTRAGCGQKIVWSQLPKLADKIILELFKVNTIEQVKELIKKENFVDTRRNYEQQIDATFHH